MTLIILGKTFKSKLPLNFFELIPSDSATIPDTDQFAHTIMPGEMSNLLHDAALKCLKFLHHDVDLTSVACILRYLAWVLPYAAESPELEAACSLGESFVCESTSGAYALSPLKHQVTTAMQEYRQRCLRDNID